MGFRAEKREIRKEKRVGRGAGREDKILNF